jgi:hypothetical protein
MNEVYGSLLDANKGEVASPAMAEERAGALENIGSVASLIRRI